MQILRKSIVALLGLALVHPIAGCQPKETKRTTVEMKGPETERKLTIETTKTVDDDD